METTKLLENDGEWKNTIADAGCGSIIILFDSRFVS